MPVDVTITINPDTIRRCRRALIDADGGQRSRYQDRGDTGRYFAARAGALEAVLQSLLYDLGEKDAYRLSCETPGINRETAA